MRFSETSTCEDTTLLCPGLFADVLLENSSTKPRDRKHDFIVSVLAHAILLAMILLVPLYFTERLDVDSANATQLVGPPAPAFVSAKPTAAVPQTFVAPTKVATSGTKLSLPRPAVEEVPPTAPGLLTGVAPGVPGAIPGGQLGGIIGGILTELPPTYVSPPPSINPAPKTPTRVGGNIREPRLISAVNPTYPVVLRHARVSGDVVIDAVVNANGDVTGMQPVSGPRLLVLAAMDAVRHWKYQPTLLNGEPIPVIVRVTVTFRLKPSS